MGFLTRLLKTPNDDEDEMQDELRAEETGLLMASSIPREEDADTPPDTGVDAPPDTGADAPPEAAAEMPPEAEDAAPTGEDGAESPAEEEQDEPAQDSAPAEPEAPVEPPPDESPEEPSDDPLAVFRSSQSQRRHTDAFRQDLVEVPLDELLAEARSIRDALRPAAPSGDLIEEAEQEAA
jgi:hypothetical protein